VIPLGILLLTSLDADGTYAIKVIYGSSGTAETTFEFSGSEIQLPKPTGHTIAVDRTNFSLSYSINGGSLLNVNPDSDTNSLTITMDATRDGELIIALPRTLIDAKIGNSDGEFFVLVDGEEVQFEETVTRTDRILMIVFPDGAKEIQIIGTLIVSTQPKQVPYHEPTTIYVSTVKSSYKNGETIEVFGEVNNLLFTVNKVSLSVIEPRFGNQVAIQQFEVGPDKKFRTEITGGGPLWKASGEYTIIVRYGSESVSAETTFNFIGSNTNAPQPEPEPEPDSESEIWGKIIRLYQQRYPYYDLLHIDSESNNIRDVLCEKTFGENGQKYYDNCFSTDLTGKSTKFNAGTLNKIPHQKLRVELYTNSHEQLLDTEFFNWNGFPGDKPIIDPILTTPKPNPNNSETQITFYVYNKNYQYGDTIIISGYVTPVIVATPVTIQVLHGTSIVDIAQVLVSSDGTFTQTIRADGPSWKNDGKYIVRATYGHSKIVETNFLFESNEFLIPKKQEPQVGKVTVCHNPPGNSGNLHTLSISANALQTHLSHGDSVGECDTKSTPSIVSNRPNVSTPQETPTVPQIDSSPQNDDRVDDLIEENKKLREELERQGSEIDSINEQVDYLKEIVIQFNVVYEWVLSLGNNDLFGFFSGTSEFFSDGFESPVIPTISNIYEPVMRFSSTW